MPLPFMYVICFLLGLGTAIFIPIKGKPLRRISAFLFISISSLWSIYYSYKAYDTIPYETKAIFHSSLLLIIYALSLCITYLIKYYKYELPLRKKTNEQVKQLQSLAIGKPSFEDIKERAKTDKNIHICYTHTSLSELFKKRYETTPIDYDKLYESIDEIINITLYDMTHDIKNYIDYEDFNDVDKNLFTKAFRFEVLAFILHITDLFLASNRIVNYNQITANLFSSLDSEFVNFASDYEVVYDITTITNDRMTTYTQVGQGNYEPLGYWYLGNGPDNNILKLYVLLGDYIAYILNNNRIPISKDLNKYNFNIINTAYINSLFDKFIFPYMKQYRDNLSIAINKEKNNL